MPEFIVKKRSSTVQRTCRIEEDLLDRIEGIVDTCNLPSANSLVNKCIRFALDNMLVEKVDNNIMRRIKMKNYVQTTYRVEECLFKRIKKEVALNKNYSINSFINDCIRYSLDNIVIVE